MIEKANETGRPAVVLHTDGDIILAPQRQNPPAKPPKAADHAYANGYLLNSLFWGNIALRSPDLCIYILERETGIEPATFSLGS
jgi:hypothetical protein